MPFGAVGAVYSWDRLGAFLAGVLTDLFDIPVSRYVDDLFTTDFEELAEETREIMLAVVDLLGFTLEKEKTPPPAVEMEVLGVSVALDSSGLSFAPEPRKAKLWILTMATALNVGRLALQAASKLAGRLNFAASSTWGPVARHRIRRLYHLICRGGGSISPRLREDLEWWIDRLEKLVPRRFLFASAPVSLVYTDAEGSGGLGGFMSAAVEAEWLGGQVSPTVPPLLLPRKTQIFLFEIIAVLVSAKVWTKQLLGTSVVFFVDNQSALAALKKGGSRVADAHSLVGVFWDVLVPAIQPASIHFYYVPSALNLADAPSRSEQPSLLARRTPLRLRWEWLAEALAAPSSRTSL